MVVLADLKSLLNNMEEETVVAPTSEEQVEVVEETSEEETENPELTKAQQIAENQRIRAEKAEKELKALKSKGEVNSKEPTPQLSTADIIALSKVHEDDVERVERFAKSEGISVREALKNDELKEILSLRDEQRTTASAANVSTTRRSSAKLSDDVIVSNASNGKIPEDDDGIARLVAAKMKK